MAGLVVGGQVCVGEHCPFLVTGNYAVRNHHFFGVLEFAQGVGSLEADGIVPGAVEPAALDYDVPAAVYVESVAVCVNCHIFYL